MFTGFKIEYLQLVLALGAVAFYGVGLVTTTHEPGKLLYWVGVVILTTGLLLMRG